MAVRDRRERGHEKLEDVMKDEEEKSKVMGPSKIESFKKT